MALVRWHSEQLYNEFPLIYFIREDADVGADRVNIDENACAYAQFPITSIKELERDIVMIIRCGRLPRLDERAPPEPIPHGAGQAFLRPPSPPPVASTQERLNMLVRLCEEADDPRWSVEDIAQWIAYICFETLKGAETKLRKVQFEQRIGMINRIAACVNRRIRRFTWMFEDGGLRGMHVGRRVAVMVADF